MNKDIRFFTNQYSNNRTFPLIVGAAFGFGWTPCIGPILGSILTLAALEENIAKGILLLSFYSLGLPKKAIWGIIFLLYDIWEIWPIKKQICQIGDQYYTRDCHPSTV